MMAEKMLHYQNGRKPKEKIFEAEPNSDSIIECKTEPTTRKSNRIERIEKNLAEVETQSNSNSSHDCQTEPLTRMMAFENGRVELINDDSIVVCNNEPTTRMMASENGRIVVEPIKEDAAIIEEGDQKKSVEQPRVIEEDFLGVIGGSLMMSEESGRNCV